jgi:hypothetical protein
MAAATVTSPKRKQATRTVERRKRSLARCAVSAHTETQPSEERRLWDSECRAGELVVGLDAAAMRDRVAAVAAGACTTRKGAAIAEVVARRWPS